MLEDFPVPASPKKQTVVCFLALDKRFRVVDQLLLWNFVADKIRKAHIRNVGNRDNLNVLSCMRNTKCLVKSQFFPLRNLCKTEPYQP